MFGFGKKKVDKAVWAIAVYGKPVKHPEKESEEQLKVLTTGMLMQHHRIIMDSVRLVHTTKNLDTKQGRIDLCRKHYQEMQKFKPFCDKEQLAMIKNAEDAMKGVGL